MLDLSEDGNWDDYGQAAAVKVIDDVRTSIAYQRIHVAIVTFTSSSSGSIEVDLDDNHSFNSAALLQTIDDLSSESRGSRVNFYAGFVAVNDVINRSARTGVDRLVVLITSADTSQSDRDEAIDLAQQLQEGGVYIYGIFAERRRDVRRTDEEFMQAVINLERDNIPTSEEFVDMGDNGYFCSQLNCESTSKSRTLDGACFACMIDVQATLPLHDHLSSWTPGKPSLQDSTPQIIESTTCFSLLYTDFFACG